MVLFLQAIACIEEGNKFANFDALNTNVMVSEVPLLAKFNATIQSNINGSDSHSSW